MGFRQAKLWMRNTAPELTQDNAKEVLLYHLLADGGENRESYKWLILRALIAGVKHRFNREGTSFGEMLNLFRLYPAKNMLGFDYEKVLYDNNDLHHFIEEMQFHLVAADDVFNQVIVMLSFLTRFMEKNSSQYTLNEPLSIKSVKRAIGQIKQHFYLDATTELTDDIYTQLASIEGTRAIIAILTTEKFKGASLGQELEDLYTLLIDRCNSYCEEREAKAAQSNQQEAELSLAVSHFSINW